MEIRIEKDGNYIIAKNVAGDILFQAPSINTIYYEEGTKIELRSDFGETNKYLIEESTEFKDAVGGALTGGVLTWIRANTGFNTASGGSEANIPTVYPTDFGAVENDASTTANLQTFFDYVRDNDVRGDFKGTWYVNTLITIQGVDKIYHCGAINAEIGSNLDNIVRIETGASMFFGEFECRGSQGGTETVYTSRDTKNCVQMATVSGRNYFERFNVGSCTGWAITTEGNTSVILNWIGNIKAWNCGSGNSATREHTFDIEGYTTDGVAGTITQTSTINFVNDIDSAIDDYSYFEINGRIHSVVAGSINLVAKTVAIYPWIDTTITATVPSPFTCKSYHGGGLLIVGSNTANFKVSQIDSIGAGVCVASYGLYGADIGIVEGQFCQITYSMANALSIGNVVSQLYSEGAEFSIHNRGVGTGSTSKLHLMVASGPTRTGLESIGQLSPYDGSNNEVRFASPRIELTYLNERYVFSRTRVQKNEIAPDFTITNTPEQSKATTFENNQTFELKWNEESNNLFGYDTLEVICFGTGANNEPTGTITFDLDSADQTAGITVMGGATYLITGAVNPINVQVLFDYTNQDWLINYKGEAVEIVPSLEVSNPTAPELLISRNDTTITDGESLGLISFAGNDANLSDADYRSASIEAIATSSWGIGSVANASLLFKTRQNELEVPQERVRIDSRGNFGVGKIPKVGIDLLGTLQTTARVFNYMAGDVDPTASTAVVGVGTNFLTDIEIGDGLRLNGELRTVVSITDELNLTVDLAYTNTGNETLPERVPAQIIHKDSVGAVSMIVDEAGNTGIGMIAPKHKLDVNGGIRADGFRLNALQTAPTTATDTGTLGEIRIDASYIYVCTATDIWVRSAIVTW